MRTNLHRTLALALALAGAALGHDSQKPVVDKNATWMEKHMAEEHHISSWDANSFFSLHDYNADGVWQQDELRRTYGLMDPTNKDVSLERRDQIVKELMELLDTNHDGSVSRAEWDEFIAQGKTLPDMGTGPGHHGDDEFEYELHHWEKYHDDDTKLEDLTHPEDIAHFKHHEELERAEQAQDAMDLKTIIENNIPAKFQRQG
ncbi:secretory pathway protein Ssp120 [Drechmeria coniospora]|uniref:Secretory pathway protein Ssp120 n=1 Tax=Drechmeria coniospora TaxID=98403 RepID=A0A151GVY3_DRECN|nr:secretory pathway protein Ssp120 [Drechmeria coniospora]KYK61230.1 secretory pathway protein Ssp120 [Drechmeria coniospora]ODA80994.1 hypothetical protein RJ55_03954 [Drechmeria coniospora]